MAEETFSEWLASVMKDRGFSQARLASLSGLSRGSISHIMNGTREAGTKTCQAIAQALRLPEKTVMEKAGLLTPQTPTDEDPDINYIANMLNDEKIQEWIRYGRYLLEEQEKNQKGE